MKFECVFFTFIQLCNTLIFIIQLNRWNIQKFLTKK